MRIGSCGNGGASPIRKQLFETGTDFSAGALVHVLSHRHAMHAGQVSRPQYLAAGVAHLNVDSADEAMRDLDVLVLAQRGPQTVLVPLRR